MKRLLSKEEMAYWDSYTINNKHIPALVLMERAALACVDNIIEQDKLPNKVGVICGPGNNGGDGVAIARILKCKGISSAIYMLGDTEKYTDSLKAQLRSAESYEVEIVYHKSTKDAEKKIADERRNEKSSIYIEDKVESNTDIDDFIKNCDFLVDGIFGIGLSREVNGEIARVIKAINSCTAPVLAVDIPSGFDANTGKMLGIGVNADYTVTFGYGKKGLFLSDCYLNAGKITTADIGIYIDSNAVDITMPGSDYINVNNGNTENKNIEEKSIDKIYEKKEVTDIREIKSIDFENTTNSTCYILEDKDIDAYMPSSSRSDNKGTRGKVLIIAGSENIYGACFLSAKAALTAGCGLVRVFTHQNNIQSIQQGIPEAMYYGYSDFTEKDMNELKSMIKWADAVLLGPGLGTGYVSSHIMKVVLDCCDNSNLNNDYKIPLVIDADGINILSKDESLKEKLGLHITLTPHLKEMSRLCGDVSVLDIQNNMETYAVKLHEQYQCNIDLKSFTSFIVTNAGYFINTTGNEGMATAGSGDVLAGIMVSLIAQGVNLGVATAMAAYIHGKSGEAASGKKGIRGMLASDCIGEL